MYDILTRIDKNIAKSIFDYVGKILAKINDFNNPKNILVYAKEYSGCMFNDKKIIVQFLFKMG